MTRAREEKIWTAERCKKLHQRIVMFTDGAKGAASQHYECTEFPDIKIVWQRESGKDNGVITYYYRDWQFATLDELCDKLNELNVPFPAAFKELKS